MNDEPVFVAYGAIAFVIGLPLAVGLAAIIAGARRWQRFRRLLTDGQAASGTVTDNQMRSGSEGSMSFLPVVRFHARDGQEITTVLEDSPQNRSHLAGTTIDVLYDPDDPKRAVTAGGRSGGGIGAIVFGVLFLAFAATAYAVIASSGFVDLPWPTSDSGVLDGTFDGITGQPVP